jgi:hypothetical protein
MSEPRLKLVDYALAEVPHKEQDEPVIRKILDRFGPSIAKKARQDERAGIFQALGAQNLEEASQLARVRAERDARPTPAEEAKHCVGNRWRGRVEGIVIGAMLACLAIFAMQQVIWDTAARSFREQAMTGAMLSSQDERELYSRPAEP